MYVDVVNTSLVVTSHPPLLALWPHRVVVGYVLLLMLLLSIPLQANIISQLSLNYDVRGRGVLWLTVIEQRINLLSGIVVIAQVAIFLDAISFGNVPCRLIGLLRDFLGFHGTIGGLSIAVCR